MGVWAGALLSAGALAGCTGIVAGQDQHSGGRSNGALPGAGGSGGGGSTNPAVVGVTEACPAPVGRRLVPLSELQYVSSLRALLGDAAVAKDGAPKAETKAFIDVGLVPTTGSLNTQLNWSEHATATLIGKELQVSGCAADPSDACASRFLKEFGAKAFRRPVADLEIADLMAVYTGAKATGDFASALRLAVQALLSAPSFAYRTEFGSDDGQGRFSLTAHELASTLSYFLSDAPPDAELRAAADAGTLLQPGEIEKHVTRLLASSAVQSSLTGTMLAAWRVANVFGSAKDPSAFPEFNAQLTASMYRETQLFVDDVLWKRAAPIAELLTSRDSFVDDSLAKIYGVPYTGTTPGEFVKVTLPANQRSGLLTQPSLMSALSRTDQTSVVARGLFMRGAILCLPKIPQPPADLAGAIQAQLAADMTEKQRAEYRKTTQPCGGCHKNFDPFGLLLEAYDPIGRYRSEIKGVPVDAAMDLSGLGSFSGAYDGAVKMAEAAAASPDFAACVTRNLAVYATGAAGLTTDACQLQKVVASLPQGPVTFAAVVSAVAKSSMLSVRAQETM
jgi:Protein of unknown function (DUF1592)/Protein of unknown function (DUF1588)/Protein of unknown function (DUF1595)/Protein of unknown function (DUF1585)